MTTLANLDAAEVSKEIKVNDNFETLSAAGIFGKKQSTTSALTWGGYGGRYNGNDQADWTVSLTDNATNYIVVLRSTAAPSVSTATTHSTDPLYARVYKITTLAGVVTDVVDERWEANGLFFAPGSVGTPGDMILASVQTVTGAKTFNDGKLKLAGSSSGAGILHAPAAASTYDWTLPAANDTLVGKATTDTLTNKTFDTAGAGNSLSINGVAVTANTGTGAVARASAPTFTNPIVGTQSPGDNSTKAASTAYTDTAVATAIAGLSWKQEVRAGTTANGTLATAFANGQTIDGVTLATGDRILIKNQSSGAENGIYVVAASGAPARATDADSGSELVNASVYISEGTTLADTQWTCTTNAPITPGSTSLAFATFSAGSVAVGSITGMGSGVATFLATPSSANLAAALTDETGSGAAVFAVSPALTGSPTAPTQSALDNSTKIASTAYADTADALNTPIGKHAIWIAAGSMTPSATGGCAALATIATTANQPDVQSLDFDTTTQEFAQFSITMPKSWNEGTVTFAPVWSHAATTTNFGVVWQLQGYAASDNDAIATAYGTAQTSTDTGGTTNNKYFGPASAAITIAGSPAAEDTVFFRVARVPSDGSDTMAIDARLMGIVLYITTDAGTDA